MYAITGTNGKTTVAALLQYLLNHLGETCGRLGTINYDLVKEVLPATTTTPGPLELKVLLRKMLDNQATACVMEVSSHALDQSRVDYIEFDGAVFTNITHDHLDYHKTRAEYLKVKKDFIKNLKPGAIAILNRDSGAFWRMRRGIKSKVISYGRSWLACARVKNVQLSLGEVSFQYHCQEVLWSVTLSLSGEFNIQNAMAALTVAHLEKFPQKTVAKAFSEFKGIPGRCELIPNNLNVGIMIDYAHTTDSLKRILKYCKRFCKNRMIVVFGCGGDRDKSKRPRMGRGASGYADISILTSDNPRSEDPLSIIEDIARGFRNKSKYIVEVDRKKAIIRAIRMAQKNDFILIAGKGHENTQQIGSAFYPFSDKQTVLECLQDSSAPDEDNAFERN
ncbi:UDP-N-acetylmuramoyl-L-alanyl-D-glutamate--2,6-diaminopimelate ligase [PVC group bacterium]|nr:UDP-N-acetylmuramoyl-L-alanyl-D-glutamate--2,6-diaminopimelate ligase [PVC group bacterium]